MVRVAIVIKLVVLVLAVSYFIVTQVTKPDIGTATYTANEVIEAAEQMPFPQELYGYHEQTKHYFFPYVNNLSWDTQYLGDGVWSVMLSWQQEELDYGSGWYSSNEMTWYFYEDTGEFVEVD